MRTAILDALEARYEAQVAEAHATIKIYLENPLLCDGDGPIAKYRKWFTQFYA